MNKYKVSIIGLVSMLLLSSCAREGGNFWFHSAKPSERVSYYKEVCKGYGYRVGTSSMTECVAAEIREKRRIKNEAFDSIDRSFENLSNSYGRNRVTCQNYGSVTNCRQY